MHELSITENLLEIAITFATKVHAKRIVNLYLTIGEMSSFVDDSVQFYWDIVTKNTIAENSKLNFNRINAEFICNDCKTKYHRYSEHLTCPNCNGYHVSLVAGDEFLLEAIDIDE
jgi:hydrogenase nickel incorporation protein HypA/HybF